MKIVLGFTIPGCLFGCLLVAGLGLGFLHAAVDVVARLVWGMP